MVLERKYNYWNRNDEDNEMPQNNVQSVVSMSRYGRWYHGRVRNSKRIALF
jgi:hypothetical protein